MGYCFYLVAVASLGSPSIPEGLFSWKERTAHQFTALEPRWQYPSRGELSGYTGVRKKHKTDMAGLAIPDGLAYNGSVGSSMCKGSWGLSNNPGDA